MENNSLKYTCIFGGGAIRGLAYVGALKALEELGIEPQNIGGSSVGAVFSGLVAVGYSAQELKEIFLKVNFELFKDIHFGFGSDFALSKGEVFLEWLRDLIEKKYYGNDYKKGSHDAVTFADLDKNLVIITTDLKNFRYKEFSKFETPDFEIATAIRISSTMPGLMKPFKYNNTVLVDGDLQKSWPLWRLSKSLCNDEERILEFRLEGNYEGKDKTPIDYINTVYSCVTSLATDFIMDTYSERDKFDYIIVNTGDTIVVDFNQSEKKRLELIDEGYKKTMTYFQDELPQKKEKILDCYKSILKHLKRMETCFKINNDAKIEKHLGRLFMELSDSKKYIDTKDYELIKQFKDVFISNSDIPSILGIPLKKGQHSEISIHFLVETIEKKVEELENYIQGMK